MGIKLSFKTIHMLTFKQMTVYVKRTVWINLVKKYRANSFTKACNI